MELKTFGIKGKLISVKQKLSRIISNLRKEDYDFSSPTPAFTAAPYKPVNLLTNYALEAELNKAEALALWRMSDQPK